MLPRRLTVALIVLFALGCDDTSTPTGPGITDNKGEDKRIEEDGTVAPPDARTEGDAPDSLFEETVDIWIPPDTLDSVGTDLAEIDVGGPACEAGEGCFLDKCVENSDCLSGYCIEHLGEDVCTLTCVEECPGGFECMKVDGAEPDVIFACLSKWPRLCLPCTSNQDCKTGENLGSLCIQPGEEVEYFCGTNCGFDQDCPSGYSCLEVTTIDGMYGTQCVAADGTCVCTDKAVSDSLYTLCESVNEWGTCQGFRKCEEEGLSECDAAEPSEDVCDGLDNDCDGPADEETCDDDNPCTEDICNGEEGCSHASLDLLECTDGDLCTTGDHCEEGMCVGNPVVCDDGNPCTDDYCDETGACSSEANHELCDDGNPCTLGDVCDEGACIGTPISCDCQQDADCGILDDNDLCNGTLYCDKSGLPYKCEVDPLTVPECLLPGDADPFCQKAECQSETGECLVVPDNESFACNDNDQCTVGEKCQEGQCTSGTEYPCNDGNPCTMDSCKPESGCLFIQVDGACDDGNPCTMGDQCINGQCTPGEWLDCDDENPCTNDTCQPAAGCVHEAAEAECNDGNPCTTGDHCSNGFCMPGGAADCSDDNPCTTDSCDPNWGCLHVLNNLPCDDENVCTTQDICQNGACMGTGQLKCDDKNPCTDDSCDEANGCQFVPNDAGCDDGNLCTVDDQCINGACSAAGFLDCNDGNACTDDSCVPDTGCTHLPNQAACDDGDSCTALDECSFSKCVGIPYECDDDVQCTENVCDGGGGCFHPVTEGYCYIAGQCAEADNKNPASQCQACLPEESQNVWSALDGEPCAEVDNGDATCLDGECKLTSCDDGFDDCDGLLETGCETDLLSDNLNCGLCAKECLPPDNCADGQCSFECPEGLKNCDGECLDTQADPENCGICGLVCKVDSPEKLGVCVNGGCGEILCPANQHNLNLLPGDGCEYECSQTNGGVEACDGFDNDCDKDVDEDFDLAADSDNCGQCGKKCGPYQHADTVECAGGKCAIVECEEGYQDVDGVVLNGCEEMIATGEIWVDAWNFFDPDEDGSKGHPFDTIAEAMEVAEDGSLVHVLEGTYAGGFVISVPNLVLQGSAWDEVYILGPQYGTGVKITGAGAKLKNVTVQGAAIGVQFAGVSSGKMEDCIVVSIAGKADQEAAGVFVQNSTGVQLDGLHIYNVTGGTGKTNCSGGQSGKSGAGVLVHASGVTKITDSEIHAVKGGQGGKASCSCYKGGPGGIGAAVLVRNDSNNTSVSGNVIYNVIGGRGGNGTCGQIAGGAIGAGVYQHTGGGLVLENNVIYDIKGGLTTANKASAYSACLYGLGVGAVLVTTVTCVGSGVERQRGFWADASAQALFGVSSSIIAHVTDYCLYSHGNNFPSTLMASYSAVFDCAAGEVKNAQIAGNTIKEDPLFVDKDANDYHVVSDSPCIDTGKGSAEYCSEPKPNGCRVNMGAYGNTAEATSKPDADHCACD